MPITHSNGGTTLTGDSIHFFQLAAQRGAVGLELKGIRMSRGPVLWKRLRDHYGIPKVSKTTGKPVKGTANAQDVYDWLCAKVDELRPVQEHVEVIDGQEVRTVGGKRVI